MNINTRNLRFKIVTPIIVVSILVMAFTISVSDKILKGVANQYHSFFVARHSFEIRKLFEKAVTEITTAGLIQQQMVVEAKKTDVLEEIKLYWSNNQFEGIILTSDGTVVHSALLSLSPQSLPIFSADTQKDFQFNVNGRKLHGIVVPFPAWDWTVITVTEPQALNESQRNINLLIPLFAIAFFSIIGSVFFILSKNLKNPIHGLVDAIRDRSHVEKTGITELDSIGTAINESFSSLERKNRQFKILHDISSSINEFLSIDDLLRLILDKTSHAIQAESSAILLYDEAGSVNKCVGNCALAQTTPLPEHKRELLELIRLTVVPLMINNISEYPVPGSSLSKDQSEVKNLLAAPIIANNGEPKGSVLFYNKPGGFSEDEKSMLQVIASDTAIALNKAENLQQLKRFQQVIDSAFDIVVITDHKGLISYVNQAFYMLTGYDRTEVIGRKMNILRSGYHDNAFYKDLWDTITAGNVWKGEFINRKKSGELYQESAVIFPLAFDGTVNYVAIKRDVTQEKKLYEQLVRSQKMEAIGTLAGGIAHDFNNLLTAILGYSEIMLMGLEEGDQFHKAAKIINEAAQRGAELSKKILTVTRKEKMEVKPVNINDTILNSVELLQRSIPKDIEIVVNLNKHLPNVLADLSQIHQVVMNLAINARDAMPEGGKLTIETQTVGIEDGISNGIPASPGGFVKLSISDTGVGMEEEVRKKIFDPFFTTKEKGKGTGLGLFIVHSVVNNHNGYVNIYSEPAKGTRFTIYLPIAKGVASETPVAPAEMIGSGTILVIDDDGDVRELSRDMIESLGYKVMLAESGREGINLFREKKDEILLVIIDMIMPKMGGGEVYQALKTIKPDVKAILCSGYSNNGFAGIDTLLKSGVNGYVQKPFTRAAIAFAVKKAITEPAI